MVAVPAVSQARSAVPSGRRLGRSWSARRRRPAPVSPWERPWPLWPAPPSSRQCASRAAGLRGRLGRRSPWSPVASWSPSCAALGRRGLLRGTTLLGRGRLRRLRRGRLLRGRLLRPARLLRGRLLRRRRLLRGAFFAAVFAAFAGAVFFATPSSQAPSSRRLLRGAFVAGAAFFAVFFTASPARPSSPPAPPWPPSWPRCRRSPRRAIRRPCGAARARSVLPQPCRSIPCVRTARVRVQAGALQHMPNPSIQLCVRKAAHYMGQCAAGASSRAGIATDRAR